MNDVLWRVVDLTLHLNGLFLLMAHFDAEDPEVTASQIQRDEVSLLCRERKGGRTGGGQRERGRNVNLLLDTSALLFITDGFLSLD